MKIKKLVPVAMLLITLGVSGCASQIKPIETPSPTPTASTIPMQTVQMYYVGDTPSGFKLFSENYSFQTSGDLVTESLSRLISGRAKPVDPDYSNLWGSGTSLNVFTKDGSTGVVDLKMGKLNVGAEAESRAIDQLLWTMATIDPTITGILLLVDGERIESLAGHVDATKPIVKANDYEVLNALQISSISDGAVVSSPVTMSGEACTFEANVVWTLRMGDKTIKSSSTTAGSACPDRSKWKVELSNLEAGKYSFTVEDFSAKDGSLSARDDKNFTVATT